MRNQKIFFMDTSFISFSRRPKKLYRTFKTKNNAIKTGTHKCNDKRCKICQIYLYATDSFKMSN